MLFGEAFDILSQCERNELRDHAFGDKEVFWMHEGVEVAGGYFSDVISSIAMRNSSSDSEKTCFGGEEARRLSECGTIAGVIRNDSIGPDEFVVGEVMPGLTKEGVLKEITGK